MGIQNQEGSHLLRVQVYGYLREQMRQGILKPGASVSIKTLIEELGFSRTPLREALLLLQEQGFVTILPQRGIRINMLTQKDIRDIYEILGGIESRILLSVFDKIGKPEIKEMKRLNKVMAKAIEKRNTDIYADNNIAFHDVFLNLSKNERMKEYVKILKRQMYDFHNRDYGNSWREKNLHEHETLIQILIKNDAKKAAEYMRDVHWEFCLSVPLNDDE